MRYSLAADGKGLVLLHDLVGCETACAQVGPDLYVHRFVSLAEMGEYVAEFAARRPGRTIVTGPPPGYRELTLDERLVVDPVYAKQCRDVKTK